MILDLPRVIGHRGAAALAPENTLAGIRKAKELGASWVEFDVRLSADEQPVVFHDDSLTRTTGQSGEVAMTSFADLIRIDAGSKFSSDFAGETIPSFRDLLTLCAELGLGVNIEIKPDKGREAKTAEIALAMAQALWPDSLPALVSSFSAVSLEAAKRAAPDWPRGFLAGALPSNWREEMARLDCATVNLDHSRLTAAKVAEVTAAGFPVLAYTVNDPDRAKILWNWGVAAVFSDRPGDLI